MSYEHLVMHYKCTMDQQMMRNGLQWWWKLFPIVQTQAKKATILMAR